jgi:hypothetical protein
VIDVSMNGFTSFHQTVTEMRMLIKSISVTGKRNDVFVVAGGKSRCRQGESGFKDNLC